MICLHWLIFIVSFCIVGEAPQESMLCNIGLILFLYSIGAIPYLLIKKIKINEVYIDSKKIHIKKETKIKESVIMKNENIVNEINDNLVNMGQVRNEKLKTKRDMKKDNQVFKLIRLVIILGSLLGFSLLGVESIKALALVVAIVLGSIVLLFLFICVPILIIFKDTALSFIKNRK